VDSPQAGPHRQLDLLVTRHAAHPFRKPPAPYSRAAFEAFMKAWDRRRLPILDSGCGTGESTHVLARRHPDRLVLGVDQSLHRLSRGARLAGAPENALLLRADVVDIWLLLAREGVRLHAHMLYYPNPWPKPAHVMRRWPAHPAFPCLIGLGGQLECRSNWRVYVQEFARAIELLTGAIITVENFAASQPDTPFERKYARSGHTLYRARAALAASAGAGLIPAAP
jgi:tRNA (guanine-N7-)-methyltransferase